MVDRFVVAHLHLEVQFQSKLHGARRVGLAADDSELARTYLCVRRGKLRVIKRVECFQANRGQGRFLWKIVELLEQ